MYQIETLINGNWTTEGIGDNDPCETREEAEALIAQLRKIGDDWNAADYRIVEVAPPEFCVECHGVDGEHMDGCLAIS